MAEAFDPYHKWLGIPPSQQPPTHYRLLGLEAFEPDREVIDAAANQRMSYLQDMAAGPNGSASQKLLNEVSAARRCLLNQESKAIYDQQLREQLNPSIAVQVPDDHLTSPKTTSADFSFDTSEPVQQSTKPSGRTKRPVSPTLAVDIPSTWSAPDEQVSNATDAVLPKPELTFDTPSSGKEPEKPRSTQKKKPDVTAKAESAPKSKKIIWIVAGSVFGILAVVGVIIAISLGKSPNQKNTVALNPTKDENSTKLVESADARKTSQVKKDPDLPAAKVSIPKLQWHFVPEGKVLLDVCDIVHFQDEFHLFFIAHPNGEPDNRIWGHAVSKDLLAWKEVSINFPRPGPTETGAVFVNEKPAVGKNPPKPILSAIVPVGVGAGRSLLLASSEDGGRSWSFEPGALELPKKEPGFRRPKVVKNPTTNQWFLVVTKQTVDPKKKVARSIWYGSTDFKTWQLVSELDLPDATGVAEFLRLPITNIKTAETRWCLITEGLKTLFLDVDGKTIKPTLKANTPTLDWGPQASNPSVVQLPDGKFAILAVLKNQSDRPSRYPAILSLPSEFRLVQYSNGLNFQRSPTKELFALRTPKKDWKDLKDVVLKTGAVPLGQNRQINDSFALEFDILSDADQATIDITARGFNLSILEKEKQAKVADKATSVGFYQKKLSVIMFGEPECIEVWFGSGPLIAILQADPSPGKSAVIKLSGAGCKLPSVKLNELRSGSVAAKP